MKLLPASSLTRLLPVSAAAALLLTGCATRAPREIGPPSTPVMPPPQQTAGEDLPPPLEVEMGPIETVDLPPLDPAPGPAPAPAPAVRPAVAPRPGTPYTIKKGESLSAIAARNRISWVKLAEYNRIADPNRVQAGQTILIPAVGGAAAPAPSGGVVTPPPPANSGNTYVVQSGDNLTRVARRYNTTVAELKDLNGLRSDRLLVGQILKLPAGAVGVAPAAPVQRDPAPAPAPRVQPTPVPTRPVPTPVPEVSLPAPEAPEPAAIDPLADEPFTIVVMEGDTLETIASNYVVSEEEIRKINNLPANATLTPGQTLKMPPGLY